MGVWRNFGMVSSSVKDVFFFFNIRNIIRKWCFQVLPSSFCTVEPDRRRKAASGPGLGCRNLVFLHQPWMAWMWQELRGVVGELRGSVEGQKGAKQPGVAWCTIHRLTSFPSTSLKNMWEIIMFHQALEEIDLPAFLKKTPYSISL